MVLPENYRNHLYALLPASIFVVTLVTITFYALVMIEPHLTPIIWALLMGIVLRPIKSKLENAITSAKNLLPPQVRNIFIGIVLVAYVAYTLRFVMSLGESSAVEKATSILVVLGLGAIVLFPLLAPTNTLSSVLLLSIAFGVLLTIIGFVVNVLYQESMIVTDIVQKFVSDNQATLDKIQEKGAHADWDEYIRDCQWLAGWTPAGQFVNTTELCHEKVLYVRDNFAELKTQALDAANTAATSLVGVLAEYSQQSLASFSRFPMALYLFFAFLTTFLDFGHDIARRLNKLSPFTDEESNQLYESITDKVLRAFAISFGGACFSLIVTLIAFRVVGFSIYWVPSFLAGLLTLIASPYIIWAPSLAFAIARDGVVSIGWPLMVVILIGGKVALDMLLARRLGGDSKNPSVMSLALVLGVYSFGKYGVLIGPLVAGLLMTMVDIHEFNLDRLSKDRSQSQSPSQQPQQQSELVLSPVIRQVTANVVDEVKQITQQSQSSTETQKLSNDGSAVKGSDDSKPTPTSKAKSAKNGESKKKSATSSPVVSDKPVPPIPAHMKLLVLYGFQKEDQVSDVAQHLSQLALDRKIDVLLKDVRALQESKRFNMNDYDAIIIGSSAELNTKEKFVVDFIKNWQLVLKRKPVAFFTVSSALVAKKEERSQKLDRIHQWMNQLLKDALFRPQLYGAFSGSVHLEQMGLVEKALTVRHLKQVTDEPINSNKPYSGYQWSSIEQFLDDFLGGYAQGWWNELDD